MRKFFTIAAALASLAACKERVAQIGDTVAIHFSGFLNGVQFAGGTGDADLKLGSGQFVPGFEEQLIGAKEGGAYEIKIRFPDQYVEDLAGKDVVFKVTVKEIK